MPVSPSALKHKKKPKHHSIGGFIANAGHGVRDALVGVATAPYYIGQAAYHDAGFGHSSVPGSDLKAMGSGIAHSMWDYYSPAVHGLPIVQLYEHGNVTRARTKKYFKQYAENIYDNPAEILIDAATVASGGGAAAGKVGSLAAKAGEASSLARLGAKAGGLKFVKEADLGMSAAEAAARGGFKARDGSWVMPKTRPIKLSTGPTVHEIDLPRNAATRAKVNLKEWVLKHAAGDAKPGTARGYFHPDARGARIVEHQRLRIEKRKILQATGKAERLVRALSKPQRVALFYRAKGFHDAGDLAALKAARESNVWEKDAQLSALKTGTHEHADALSKKLHLDEDLRRLSDPDVELHILNGHVDEKMIAAENALRDADKLVQEYRRARNEGETVESQTARAHQPRREVGLPDDPAKQPIIVSMAADRKLGHRARLSSKKASVPAGYKSDLASTGSAFRNALYTPDALKITHQLRQEITHLGSVDNVALRNALTVPLDLDKHERGIADGSLTKISAGGRTAKELEARISVAHQFIQNLKTEGGLEALMGNGAGGTERVVTRPRTLTDAEHRVKELEKSLANGGVWQGKKGRIHDAMDPAKGTGRVGPFHAASEEFGSIHRDASHTSRDVNKAERGASRAAEKKMVIEDAAREIVRAVAKGEAPDFSMLPDAWRALYGEVSHEQAVAILEDAGFDVSRAGELADALDEIEKLRGAVDEGTDPFRDPASPFHDPDAEHEPVDYGKVTELIREAEFGLKDLTDELAGMAKGEVHVIPTRTLNELTTQLKGAESLAQQLLNVPTKLWRDFVLSLKGSFYTNNFLGNLLLGIIAYGPITYTKALISAGSKRAPAGAVVRRAAPEFERSGFTRTVAEDAGGSQHLFPGGRKNPANLMHDLGQYLADKGAIVTEDNFRAAAGKVELDRTVKQHAKNTGLSKAEAADEILNDANAVDAMMQRAYDNMLDYSKLTPLERDHIRPFLPFWAFTRAITGRTVRLLTDEPWKLVIMGEMSNEVLRENKDTLGSLPEYLRGVAVTGPYDKKTQTARGVSTYGMNPFSAVADQASQVASVFSDDPKLSEQNPLSSLNPYVKSGLEALIGKDLFIGRDLKGPKGQVYLQQLALNYPQYAAYYKYKHPSVSPYMKRDLKDTLVSYGGLSQGTIDMRNVRRNLAIQAYYDKKDAANARRQEARLEQAAKAAGRR